MGKDLNVDAQVRLIDDLFAQPGVAR